MVRHLRSLMRMTWRQQHGSSFVFTSSTTVFGDALVDKTGPATWITEDVVSTPKNIYGVTKKAPEEMCQLFHRNKGLNVVVLRTSRFFLEDDDEAHAVAYEDMNAKTTEFLYRRADIQDIVDAHVLALEKAPLLGFAR
ncbi:hypothetical protein, variant [Sphaeroforma arctica JP610]|uniref:NAD-dependent epimerase/dehydratase domain-containing protein n=1 Tax=Sphaeroforma arctica JP610 TaxID=667725 RepID=A0A0L0FLQ3_9EUKA|nr:hypothetical protein, variant [Sphaeroforma arctica JP610]KNC77707.1 hypothetical protein, variant [Sphaeroforma arctica JP610]|eukprot:XP_014151609.1 hypothetical protein, variant [Sphaeroforma arctica JP610]